MCIIGDGDPRTCEEQNRWGNVYPRSGGLSPHMRRTDQPPEYRFLDLRFIPARAGNRPAPPVCIPTRIGLSPHLRGTV